MKNLKIYILALGALSLTACSDTFLDSEPITTITDVNFYKTPADANKALIGCYDGLQRLDGVAMPILSEICSDNSFGGTGNGDGLGYQAIEEFDKSRSPLDKDLFNSNWITYYKAIYRCNMLLSKLDQIDWKGDTEARVNTEAEAKFLRAYLYFDMARIWGSIPLITVATAENVPQSTPEEVYKVIAQDLKFAADSMISAPYTVGWAAANDGRVTKWAAKSLLARVYMFYTGYYEKTDLAGVVTKTQALAGLEDVITGSGYELLTNYANLWSPASLKDYAGEGNKETIFAIKYNYTSDYTGISDGNNWMVMMGFRNVTKYPYSKGWGACTIDPNLWAAFSANDTRKIASIISIVDENMTPDLADQREYTGYISKKYSPMSNKAGNKDTCEVLGAVNFQIGQYRDYVSIRYADVLLMAAELGSTNALTYLNAVRTRAGLTAETAVTKDIILTERRLEFSGEGIRYWDMLRQGINTAASILDETATVTNGGVSTTKIISGAKFKITKGMQQIPSTQISLSKNVLVQNPGW